MKNWFFSILFFSALFSAFFSALFSTEAWAEIQLKSVEYRGSGCPQGSVRAVLAPDGSAFSVLYDRYNTEVGEQITLARKTCSVILHLTKPRNLGFRVDAADFRGFVALDENVVASQNVKVMSGPNPGHRKLSAEFGNQVWKGPINEDYTLRAVRPVNRRPPILDCVPRKENTDIVVDSTVQITNGGPNKNGQLTVDTADGVLLQKFSLTWIDCSSGQGRGGR